MSKTGTHVWTGASVKLPFLRKGDACKLRTQNYFWKTYKQGQDADVLFPFQVSVAGYLDSNLDFASAFLKEVEMLIVVMVVKIKINKL